VAITFYCCYCARPQVLDAVVEQMAPCAACGSQRFTTKHPPPRVTRALVTDFDRTYLKILRIRPDDAP
jgi:hypothetical protein